MRTCVVEGCNNTQPSKSQRGLCNMHYSRYRRTGSTDARPKKDKQTRFTKVKSFREIMPCKVDGCDRLSNSIGLCRMHYTRFKKYGRTGSSAPTQRNEVPDGGHGWSTHPLFEIWRRFILLQERWGYEICDSWKHSFENFVADMGTRPSRMHTLYRIDEGGPYSPDNCMWATSKGIRNARLAPVSLAQLQNEIIKPGIEKFLTPLALYRGNYPPGRIHRMFNFAISMMVTECRSFDDGAFLSHNEDFAQLCGPPSKVSTGRYLEGFFSRLRLNPKVTDNAPGLTGYVKAMKPLAFNLIPVPLHSAYKSCAPWRLFDPSLANKKLRRSGGNIRDEDIKSADRFYPYVLHERGNPANRLADLVHAVVPRGLPDQIRADVCQDLIVDLLTGDISEDALIGSPRKYVGQKLKVQRYSERFTSQSMDSELIDIIQYDEAKHRFDEYVDEQLEETLRERWFA